MTKRALEELGGILSSRSPPNLRVAPPSVRAGEPWRVILEVSADLEVDLVVVGSHGYGTLDRILGTTAGRVANLATRNVLVVHERPQGSRAHDRPR
jgi:nucleotide-binding universal stress UspA family protein